MAKKARFNDDEMILEETLQIMSSIGTEYELIFFSTDPKAHTLNPLITAGGTFKECLANPNPDNLKKFIMPFQAIKPSKDFLAYGMLSLLAHCNFSIT